MDWDAVGAVGEIVAAIAVVLSLLYLATQIKSQNRESRVGALHDISAGFREATSKFATADMTEIMVKAEVDFDQLTDAEALRFVILSGQLLRAWEEAFIQFQENRLDERGWNAIMKYYQNILGSTAMQHVWSIRSDYFDHEFAAFVDSLDLREYKIR